jgi:large subunit ribosomal protein L15
MKLHDLRPPAGSNTARTRVGRGIAAGKGKTAGRGTKGQKARAGGSIPPWFEGGQTPLHMRIPKLRGFKNRFKVDYEVVNVGAIAQRVEAGAFAESGGTSKAGNTPKAAGAPKKGEPLTINADVLRAVGLVRNVKKPLKILGAGELSTALFVVADAFTKSATQKIEAAGGAVSVLEVPAETTPALGVGDDGARAAREPRTAAGRAAADRKADARVARAADAAESAAEAAAISTAKAAPPKKRAAKSSESADPTETTSETATETIEATADAEPSVDAAPETTDEAAEAVDATEPANEADTDSAAAGDESA